MTSGLGGLAGGGRGEKATPIPPTNRSRNRRSAIGTDARRQSSRKQSRCKRWCAGPRSRWARWSCRSASPCPPRCTLREAAVAPGPDQGVKGDAAPRGEEKSALTCELLRLLPGGATLREILTRRLHEEMPQRREVRRRLDEPLRAPRLDVGFPHPIAVSILSRESVGSSVGLSNRSRGHVHRAVLMPWGAFQGISEEAGGRESGRGSFSLDRKRGFG